MNNRKRIWTGAVAALTALSLLAGCSTVSAEPSVASAPSPAPAVTPAATAPDLGDISVISRENGSGTRGAFIELFGIEEKGADGTKIDHTTVEASEVNKTDIMLQTVAGDPASIGYVSLGSLTDSVKALKIDGAVPSAATMLDGSYKISRPFNIATKGEPTGLAKDFIDFILSAEGQKVVSSGYVAIDGAAPAYTGTKPAGKLVVGGSSSVFPIMEKLQEAYLALNPNATIEVQSSDSTAGMTGTVDGIFDIGMASRDLKDSEKEKLTGISIAIDGIAVIVNPGNPIDELTSDNIKSIFTGETLAWNELG